MPKIKAWLKERREKWDSFWRDVKTWFDPNIGWSKQQKISIYICTAAAIVVFIILSIALATIVGHWANLKEINAEQGRTILLLDKEKADAISQLAADNATIDSLQGQLDTVNRNVILLQGQLETAEAAAAKVPGLEEKLNAALKESENLALQLKDAQEKLNPGSIPATWTSFSGAEAFDLTMRTFGNIRFKVTFAESLIPGIEEAEKFVLQKPANVSLVSWIGRFEKTRDWPVGIVMPQAAGWGEEVFIARDASGVPRYYTFNEKTSKVVLVDGSFEAFDPWWVMVVTASPQE